MKLIDQSVRILWPDSLDSAIADLKRCEFAGRNCYRSQDKITEDSYFPFIRNLLEKGHESPVEFADMTVELTTSRDVLAEITRHRLASFAVQSQRYVLDDKGGDIVFIKPCFWTEDSDRIKDWSNSRLWEKAMFNAEYYYKTMVHDQGMKPEDARKVLPNSTACIICMKANLREWRHILRLRTSPRAYPEMRELMGLLREEMFRLYPEFVFEEV